MDNYRARSDFDRLLKHLKRPYSPLLPCILSYTAREGAAIPATEPTEYPTPSDPLPNDTPLPIPMALEFLADAASEQGDSEKARGIYDELGQKYDRMRGAYWAYRRKQA